MSKKRILVGFSVLAGSVMMSGMPAMADLTVNGVPTGTNWVTSSVNGGALELSTELPNVFNSQIGVGPTGGNGQVGAETFTTGALPFVLDAISISTNGTSIAIPSGLSIHLYAVNTTTTAASTGYVPSTAVYTNGTPAGAAIVGANNTTGDLLGVNGSGVGQGLPVALANPTPAEVLEFDLSNGTTNDQITLAPNTLYSLEVWNTISGQALLWNRTSTPVYAGGQAYATGSGGAGATENSAISRNQIASGARYADLAVYGSAVPEPGTLSLIGLSCLGLLRRRSRQS
jgi:PEP-CTERM motif